MTQIRTGGPNLPQPLTGTAPVAAAPAVGPTNDPRELAARLTVVREAVVRALAIGDGPAVMRGVQEGIKLAEQAQAATTDPSLSRAFADARESFVRIGREVEAEAAAQPAASAIVPQAPSALPPAPPANRGPLGFFGTLLNGLGGGVETVSRALTLPLTWLADNAIDPLKHAVGGALSSAKAAIDGSIGQVPVLGQAVRFTTGLASSVVGLVDGLLTAVTHPVDTVKGLGAMLWTVSGIIPFGPKTIYDGLVHGKNPLESWQESASGTLEVGKAIFGGAIADAQAGNWSGAAGRLTGDIGSLFLGGAGAARAASYAGRFGRFGAVAAKGITTLGRVVTVDAKLMELGAAGLGKAARGIGKLPIADRLASKLAAAEKAVAADAKVLKGAAQAAEELAAPAARPHYAAPKFLQNALGRTFDELAIPKPNGGFYKIRGATLDTVQGQLRFQTPGNAYFVTETMVDRLLYHPDNAALRNALKAPDARALRSVAGQTFAELHVPRGDGSFTKALNAQIPFVDPTHFHIYAADGTRFRVPRDRMARLTEHPGNAQLVAAMEAKQAFVRAPLDALDSHVAGVQLQPRTASWWQTQAGTEAKLPTSIAGANGSIKAKIAGVSSDGKLVMQGEFNGMKVAKELDPALAFTHNPQMVYGYAWGTAPDGARLHLGEFDAATNAFRTIAQDATGKWHYTPNTVGLDAVMRNARPFTDLPMVKITPDAHVIPYDDIGISVGENAGFKIATRAEMEMVQRWHQGNLYVTERVFQTLKGDAAFVQGVRNWQALAEPAKVRLLEQAMEAYAKEAGIPTPRFQIADDLGQGTNGLFSPAKRGMGQLDQPPGTVKINRKMLAGDPADILDTVIHETAHGRQWHKIQQFQAGVLDVASAEHYFGAQFKASWDQISSAGKHHYEGYRNNLIEQDAWSIGSDFGRRISGDPAFMAVRPQNVRPAAAWNRLQEPLHVPGKATLGEIEAVVDGKLQVFDSTGARQVFGVDEVLKANPKLLTGLDFGALPDGTPLKLGTYDPVYNRFRAYAMDPATGKWAATPHTFPLEDVLRESRVLETLRRR